MTGCQVRIAERHLDIAMPGQRRHLGEWSSGLDQSADEGMPEGVQTHSYRQAVETGSRLLGPTLTYDLDPFKGGRSH